MLSFTLLLAAAQSGALTGSWAGDRLLVTVTDSGMTVQSDCSGGRVDGPLHPDARGRFTATGHFVIGHGGPQRADVPDATVPTRYDGQVEGDRMTLTIDDGRGQPRHYTLMRGARLKLLRCL